ncbi:MAG: tetratricopeptide repeat protein [Pirellulaceae bacterium]|nr:tetratricopeptide repeat protein [Pirellulaceae bacterium]
MNKYDLILDQIADDFEAVWRTNRRPELAAFLRQVEPDLKSQLAELLIPLDVEYRIKAGERVSARDYQQMGDFGESIGQRAMAESEFNSHGLDGTLDSGSKPEAANKRDQIDLPETRSAPPTAIKSKVIGPYKLLQKLGEGGMGEVWMAEQEKPVRRKVALKLIRKDKVDQKHITRFEAERQALAMMNHENIAKVFDVGATEEGEPYFVMELVQGIPFTTYCDKNKLSINERLELFIPVCKAVQHAHQKGIIHRDLKPSNVLVCLYDGKAVPKVIDFGLAKAMQHTQKLTDKTMFTEFGQVMGSLQYMSPEQAELNQLDVDTRSDIYSLGVMLYELLTGSTPIDLDTMRQQAFHKVLASIREQEPPRPSARLSSATVEAASGISDQRRIEVSKLKNILVGELDWIVMRALEKDRTRRYETANGFAADIENYLAGDVVTARPPSTAYRIRKYVRRHKGLVASFTAITSLLVAGIIVSSGFWYSADKARREADNARKVAMKKTAEVEAEKEKVSKEKTKADEARIQADDSANRAKTEERKAIAAIASQSFELANVRWNQNRTKDAVEFLSKVPLEERNFEWSLCNRLFEGSELTLPGRPNSTINDLVYSPDGSRLAISHSDGSIIVWDLKNGSEQIHSTGSSYGRCLVFSSDSRHLVAGGSDAITILSVESGSVVKQLDGVSGDTKSLAFSPDNSVLVSCSEPSYAQREAEMPRTIIWDAKTWKKLIEVPEISGRSISFSPDGTQFVIGGYEHTIETATGKNLLEIPAHNDAHFSPDGKFWYASSGDKVSQLNAKDGTLIREYESKSGIVHDFCLSPDGMRMATTHSKKTVQITNLVTGDIEQTLTGHLSDITNVCFSPDGTRLATSGNDKNVKIWNITTNSLMSQTRLVESENTHFWGKTFKLLPKSSLIVGGFGHDSSERGDFEWIVVFDYKTGNEIRRWQPHSERFESFECSADGKLVATVSEEKKSVKVWNLDSGTEVASWNIADFAAERFRVCFSPDNTTLAGAGFGREASPNGRYESVIAKFVLSTQRQTELFREKSGGFYVDEKLIPHNICFCSYGSKIAACGPRDVFVLKADTGEILSKKSRHLNHISIGGSIELSFSEATQQLTLIKPNEYLPDDGLVQIINLDSGESFQLPSDITSFKCSCFSPDGTRIVTGDKSGKLKLWNAKDGRELLEWQGHESDVSDLAWPDADRIVSVNNKGIVIHWEGRREPPYQKLDSPQYRVPHFAASRNKLVFHDLDGTIHIADPATGKTERELNGHSGEIKSICLSNYGDFVISSGSDGTVRMWDIDSGKQLRQYTELSDLVFTQLLISPDDQHLIGLTDNGTAKMWRIASDEELAQIDISQTILPKISFSPDGLRVAIFGVNAPITIWDVSSGKSVATLGEGLEISRVDFSPSGNYMVGHSLGQSYLWDIIASRQLLKLAIEAEEYISVHFSPDERRMAFYTKTLGLKIWDINLGKLVSESELSYDGIQHAEFSPDGTLVCGFFYNNRDGDGNDTIVWDVDRHRRIWEGKNAKVCFSPDSQLIAVAAKDSPILLINSETGESLHQIEVTSVATMRFSPDNQTIVLAEAADIRVMDISTGVEVRKWSTDHLGAVRHLCLSPDGRLLATTGSDNMIRLWEFRTGMPQGHFVTNIRTVGRLEFRNDGKGLLVESWLDKPQRSFALELARRSQSQFAIPTWYWSGNVEKPGWVAFHPQDGAILIQPDQRSIDGNWEFIQSSKGYEIRNGNFMPIDEKSFLFDRTSGLNAMRAVIARSNQSNVNWHVEQSELASKSIDRYARLFHQAMILASDPDNVEDWDKVYAAYRHWQRDITDDSKCLPPIVQRIISIPRSVPLSKAEFDELDRNQRFSDRRVLVEKIWPNVKAPFSPATLNREPIEKLRTVLEGGGTRTSDVHPTINVAEYRLENFEAAIAAQFLKLSESSEIGAYSEYFTLYMVHPIELAVTAMSHFKLGNTEQAQKYRQHFEKAMKMRRFREDEDCLSFAQEVDMLFDGSVRADSGVNVPKLTDAQRKTIQQLNQQIWTQVFNNESSDPLDPEKLAEFGTLVELCPFGIYVNTLGVAEYRLGNWQAAIEASGRSVELSPDEEGYPCPHPVDLAVIAMSHFELGNHGEAGDFVAQLVEAMKHEMFSNDEECLSFAKEALPVAEQVLELRRNKLGPDNAETLASMHDLAGMYQVVGQLEVVLPLLEQTFELRKANLGPDHPDTLRTLDCLVDRYRHAKQFEKTLPLLEQKLESLRSKLGPSHEDTIESMNQIVRSYRDTDKPNKALPLLGEKLELLTAKLGPNHRDTIDSMYDLATGFRDAGQLDKAITLYEQTLELRKVHLGPDHALTIDAMGTLGVEYWKARQLHRSIPLFEQILQWNETTFGREQIDPMTIANLGVNYKDAGRVEEATPLLEEAYESSGGKSRYTWIRNALADAYLKANRRDECLILLQETVKSARAEHQEESLELAAALVSTADQYLELASIQEAVDLLREAVRIRDAKAPDAWNTFNARSLLGGGLLGLAKTTENTNDRSRLLDEAEPLLVSGYEGMKERESTVPPQAANRIPESLDRLIELYAIMKVPEETEKYRKLRAEYAKDTGDDDAEDKQNREEKQ